MRANAEGACGEGLSVAISRLTSATTFLGKR